MNKFKIILATILILNVSAMNAKWVYKYHFTGDDGCVTRTIHYWDKDEDHRRYIDHNNYTGVTGRWHEYDVQIKQKNSNPYECNWLPVDDAVADIAVGLYQSGNMSGVQEITVTYGGDVYKVDVEFLGTSDINEDEPTSTIRMNNTVPILD